MYKSFRVKNFRCFRDLEISDLGRVNLIAGKNNTGKTALMEAMYLHTGNRDEETLLRSSRPRPAIHYRQQVSPDQVDGYPSVLSWETIFYDFDTSDEIVLWAETEASEPSLLSSPYESTVTLDTRSVDSRDLDDILVQLRIEDFDRFTNIDILAVASDYNRLSSYFGILDGRLVRSRRRIKPLYKSDFVRSRHSSNEEVNATRLTNMLKHDRLPALLSALEIFEPRLTGIEIWFDGLRPLIKCKIGLRQPLSLSDLGDGMNRVAGLMLVLGELRNGIVFIDEIENGVHHSVQCKVWQAIGKLARELNIQVFATTHSLEMIRAAYEAFNEKEWLADLRLYRLYRSGATNDIGVATQNELDLQAVAAFDFDYEVRG